MHPRAPHHNPLKTTAAKTLMECGGNDAALARQRSPDYHPPQVCNPRRATPLSRAVETVETRGQRSRYAIPAAQGYNPPH